MLFGYLISNLLIAKETFIEKIALGYLFGFGFFTFFLFLANEIGLAYNLPNALGILVVSTLVVCLLNLKFKKFVWQKVKFDLKSLSNLERVILIVIAVLLLTSLVSDLYWPVKDWDALVLYDYRARLFLQTGFMQEAISQGYFISYPLLTSLSHVWLYLFGVKSPMLLYWLYYLSFIVLFFKSVRRSGISRGLALVWTFLLAASSVIFEHSQWAYTNLPYTTYLFLAIAYLYHWIKNGRPEFWVVSTILLGLSTWTRYSDPFWLPILILMMLYAIKERKFIALIFYPLIVEVFRYPWGSFTSQVVTYDSSGSGPVSTFLKAGINVAQIKIVIIYLWTNVLSKNSILYLMIVYGLLFIPLFIKRKDWGLVYLTLFILGSIAILFLGTYIFSVSQSSYWMEIGDSANRLMMFLAPVTLFYLANIAKNYIVKSKK